MAAISDASPLILYARIGRLELFKELFGEILVPQAVWDEIMIDGLDRPPAREISEMSWIHLSSVTIPPPRFTRQLDSGEAEVLALAIELAYPDLYVIMDDEQGRKEAFERGLRVIGSAGIALLAKRETLVASVQPIVDELRNCGLYLTDNIVRFILESAGE